MRGARTGAYLPVVEREEQVRLMFAAASTACRALGHRTGPV